MTGYRHVSAKYPMKTLVVLSSATEFTFRAGTWSKINVFNTLANWIKNNSKMNHNHYSLTSLNLLQPGIAFLYPLKTSEYPSHKYFTIESLIASG